MHKKMGIKLQIKKLEEVEPGEEEVEEEEEELGDEADEAGVDCNHSIHIYYMR
jgi:hypothetical protein